MYKVGQVEHVKIIKISNTHIMVRCINELNWMGILHISEVSDYLVGNLGNIFNIGDKVYLKIIKIDEDKKFITFSYKLIRPKFLKNPNEFILKETKHKETNLLQNTMKVVEND